MVNMATVLAFHAHPDDEVLLTGGTMARLAAEGHRVVVAVACDGVMGAATGPGATAGTAGAVTVSRGNFSVIIASPPFRARQFRTAMHASPKTRNKITGGTAAVKIMAVPPFDRRFHERFDFDTRTRVRFDELAARTRTTPPWSLLAYRRRSEL